MDRRDFIKLSALVFVSSLLPLGFSGWAAGLATEAQLDTKSRKRFIVLFQRGAVDGLNLVIPFNESLYYDARPSIAIPNPGATLGSLEIDSTFALHPALQSMISLWKRKTLAYVHACGSPNPTRSHFEAQDYMETGTPGERNTKDGWLNRLLAVLSSNHNLTKGTINAVNIGSNLPRIMHGPMSVATLPSSQNTKRYSITDQPKIAKEFEQLYKTDKDLEEAYREGIKAREQLIKDLDEERIVADNGAPQPKGFAANCDRLAKVIARDQTIQIAFLDVGGWDTHINQGSSTGQLANHLKEFGEGVSALAKGLEDAYEHTIIVVISEFGRTVHENGHGGTDHGHGNVMWVLGGPVKGGKVYGQWPGLNKSSLYEQRDLAITTDFRHVLGYLVTKHFGLPETSLSVIFPNTPAVSASSKRYFEGLI